MVRREEEAIRFERNLFLVHQRNQRAFEQLANRTSSGSLSHPIDPQSGPDDEPIDIALAIPEGNDNRPRLLRRARQGPRVRATRRARPERVSSPCRLVSSCLVYAGQDAAAWNGMDRMLALLRKFGSQPVSRQVTTTSETSIRKA
jgi:hypothetical protein